MTIVVAKVVVGTDVERSNGKGRQSPWVIRTMGVRWTSKAANCGSWRVVLPGQLDGNRCCCLCDHSASERNFQCRSLHCDDVCPVDSLVDK